MRGKGAKIVQKDVLNEPAKEMRFDITDISKPEEREIFLKSIIASFQEIKKLGGNEHIKFTVDLLPEEVRLFERARDNQGKKLFEIGGTVKNTILRVEWHTFHCL